jgi:TatD DNase family protein
MALFIRLMKLIDVHAHLDEKRFEKDLKEVVGRAEKKGVKVIIISGVNPETNRKVLEISKKFHIVKASFGLYPIDSIADKISGLADDYPRKIIPFKVEEELKWIEEHKKDCIAIGECGLDFQVAPDYKKEQIEVFEKILIFAKKLDKPVIIHSRKAELEAIEILEKHGMKKVVMHCFSGKKSLIKRCVENGWFLSVPPVITRLDHFKVLTEIVPLENLLTETDAPYLSPIQGERNEPANVSVTIEEIAKIKGISEKEVAEKIWKNWEGLIHDQKKL